jgi:hypothetical protein
LDDEKEKQKKISGSVFLAMKVMIHGTPGRNGISNADGVSASIKNYKKM